MKFGRLSLVWAASAVLALAWTWFAGKDLNWDFMNYHYYGPFLLIHHRLGIDYFAGSLQAYLNPVGYLPLYGMIASGWHPLAVGAVLALVHSTNFILIWAITDRILPENTAHRTWVGAAAISIAFVAPLQLTMLGSTFLDPVVSIPVLGALLLLLRNAGTVHPKHALYVGLLGGLAAGLKLTNLLVLPALAFAMEFAHGHWAWQGTIRRWFLYGIGALVGFLLAHGYWSFELWREMGNPLFPLLNNVFQSPDFPASVQFQDRRFLAGEWWSVFTLPLEMLSHRGWVYAENIAADPRPLALCVCLLLWFLSRGFFVPRPHLQSGSEKVNLSFQAVLAFAGIFYLTWALSSRIGRYGLVLWLLVGPLIVAVAVRTKWRLAALLVPSLMMVCQMLFIHANGNMRWSGTTWGNKWMQVEVPQDLRTEPYRYLTLGTLSFSAIIPSFHPDSRFANIVGQYTQPAGEKMTAKMRNFLSSNLPLKVIFGARPEGQSGVPENLREDVNAALSSYGYRLTKQPCELVRLELNQLSNFNGWRESAQTKKSIKRLAVCSLEHEPELQTRTLNDLVSIDAAFDRIENTCPQYFSPLGVQTLRGGRGWMRVYFNSNTQLLTDGEQVSIRPHNSVSDVFLGNLAEWGKTGATLQCPPSIGSPL